MKPQLHNPCRRIQRPGIRTVTGVACYGGSIISLIAGMHLGTAALFALIGYLIHATRRLDSPPPPPFDIAATRAAADDARHEKYIARNHALYAQQNASDPEGKRYSPPPPLPWE